MEKAGGLFSADPLFRCFQVHMSLVAFVRCQSLSQLLPGLRADDPVAIQYGEGTLTAVAALFEASLYLDVHAGVVFLQFTGEPVLPLGAFPAQTDFHRYATGKGAAPPAGGTNTLWPSSLSIINSP